MQIYVTVNLAPEDEFSMTSQEAANAVLAALVGDPEKDICTVQMTVPAGIAGVVPTPGSLPTIAG